MENPETGERPVPKPRPKPRPLSVGRLISENPPIIKMKEPGRYKQNVSKPKASTTAQRPEESKSLEPIAARPSTQLRNPLSQAGVKVIPDNVIKERAARMAAIRASSNHDELDDDCVPPESSENKGKRLSSQTKVRAPPSLSKSEYTGKESVRSLQDLNEKMNLAKEKRKKSMEYDSDNLDMDIELFEPKKDDKEEERKSSLYSNNSQLSSASSGETDQNELRNVGPAAMHRWNNSASLNQIRENSPVVKRLAPTPSPQDQSSRREVNDENASSLSFAPTVTYKVHGKTLVKVGVETYANNQTTRDSGANINIPLMGMIFGVLFVQCVHVCGMLAVYFLQIVFKLL